LRRYRRGVGAGGGTKASPEESVIGEDANGLNSISGGDPGIPSGAGAVIEILSPAIFLAQERKLSSSRRKLWSSDCSMRTYVDRMFNYVVKKCKGIQDELRNSSLLWGNEKNSLYIS
jgi:hypothetical protein